MGWRSGCGDGLQAVDMPETRHMLIEIGVPEQISLEQMLSIIADKLNKKPRFAAYNPHKYTIVTQFLESMIKKFPALVYWKISLLKTELRNG
ncbi:MAG: hypothetical protein MZV64_16470 [Ignavibacteriales bacterium]|nr:hypothetical protein [Ignavibacteriales bacterium]